MNNLVGRDISSRPKIKRICNPHDQTRLKAQVIAIEFVTCAFFLKVYYNTGTNKQYNGNIAYQYWGTPGSLTYNYTYTYDKLNRLTGGSSADGYKETGITYDGAGDITALSRYQANTLIDQLTYGYTSGYIPSTTLWAGQSSPGYTRIHRAWQGRSWRTR